MSGMINVQIRLEIQTTGPADRAAESAHSMINAAFLDWLGIDNCESSLTDHSYLSIARERSCLLFLQSARSGDIDIAYSPYVVAKPYDQAGLWLARSRASPFAALTPGSTPELSIVDDRVRTYAASWSHKQSGLDAYAGAILEEAFAGTQTDIFVPEPMGSGDIVVRLRDRPSRYIEFEEALEDSVVMRRAVYQRTPKSID